MLNYINENTFLKDWFNQLRIKLLNIFVFRLFASLKFLLVCVLLPHCISFISGYFRRDGRKNYQFLKFFLFHPTFKAHKAPSSLIRRPDLRLRHFCHFCLTHHSVLICYFWKLKLNISSGNLSPLRLAL